MSTAVITTESLGKMYWISDQRRGRYLSLREELASMLSPQRFRRPVLDEMATTGLAPARPSSAKTEFWALKDVSFEVASGEVVGVIGRNGAGKSTLLKVLSQITEPTRGRARIHGRVASLLEVGTGFHPELTGRENIFLNGSILGMSRSEVRSKFDEIVAFSEIGQFLDTPVKRYSSGMYVRLAFSVAAHLEPEILIVDEVLAVGDAQFQKKCLGRMNDVARSGRTVLFVSHNMSTIQRLCTRGLLLEEGSLVEDGPIASIVSRYTTSSTDPGTHGFSPRQRIGTGWARITDVRIVDSHGSARVSAASDDDLVFLVDLAVSAGGGSRLSLRGLVLELMFFNDQGQPLWSVMNVDEPGVELPDSATCTVRMRLQGPTLVPGNYRVGAFLGIPFLQHVDDIPDCFTFQVTAPLRAWRPYDLDESRGNACRKAQWTIA